MISDSASKMTSKTESRMSFDFDFRPMGAEDGSRIHLVESKTKVAPSMYGFQLDIPLDSEGDMMFPDEVLDCDTIQSSLSDIGPTINSPKHAFTKLEITKRRIVNIKRLNEYIYLRVINLADNRIKDLSPLTFIPFLQVLNVAGNRISDVSELPNIPFLQALNLARNDISTTMGFQPNKLVYLNLSKNALSTLEDICEEIFPNLTVFEIRANMLTTLEGLRLPNLEELYAAENQLLDLRGIEECSKLKILHVRRNKISNLIDLCNFPQLECLNLRNNQISNFDNLKPLSTALKLETVILSENPISTKERYRAEVIAACNPTVKRVDKYLLSESEQSQGFQMRLRRVRSQRSLDGIPVSSLQNVVPTPTGSLHGPSAGLSAKSTKSNMSTL